MLNIVVVDAGNYLGRGAEYVSILFDSVRRNLPEGFPGRFICFSDYQDDYGPGIEVRKLPGHLKGWFNKLYLFKDGLFTAGDRNVFMDLDTVIVGKLDALVAYNGPLALLRDFYRPNGRQSSIMAWEAGKHTEIWDTYVDESYPEVPGGDQAWIEEFNPSVLQDAFPGLFVSYKANFCKYAPTEGASVVVFHGKPRPHECDGWVKHVWKVGGGTTAMLESVCNTAERTILQNAHDALKRNLGSLRYGPETERHVAIVGGGPSLPEGIRQIPDQCDVIGLNAAASWLLNQRFHCTQMMLDARPEMAGMVDRRAGGYLIASQCHPDVFEALRDDTVTLYHPNLPGLAEILPKGTPMIGGGSTVGLLAMVVAYVLGYRKIHLVGMDSSYANDEGHAYPQALNDADERIEVIVGDRKFTAAPWMAQQAEEFQHVAAQLANLGCEIQVHGDGLIPAVARELARKHSLAERGIIEPDGSPSCQRASAIAERIKHIAEPIGAEIGVFRGHTSRRPLSYLPTLNLLMVDSWAASSADSDYAKTGDWHAALTAADQEAFAKEAEGNVAFAPERTMILRHPSVAAAAMVEDGALDFVFVDADHSYQGCKADIEAWFPKIKAGGLICGHDYNNTEYDFGVNQAVDEFIAAHGLTLELGPNFTWFARLASALPLAA